MTTWKEMASDNRTAAYELFNSGRWRSTANRAYYAIYADATRCLLGAGVTMPAGRNNPSHRMLPALIENNLPSLSQQARSRLAGMVHQMYSFRLIGDYIPTMTLIEDDARVVLGLMKQAFQILEVIP